MVGFYRWIHSPVFNNPSGYALGILLRASLVPSPRPAFRRFQLVSVLQATESWAGPGNEASFVHGLTVTCTTAGLRYQTARSRLLTYNDVSWVMILSLYGNPLSACHWTVDLPRRKKKERSTSELEIHTLHYNSNPGEPAWKFYCHVSTD